MINKKCSDAVSISKYLRINTLRTNPDSVFKFLSSHGFIKELPVADRFAKDATTYRIDRHIPNLLAFRSNTDFHNNQLYIDGHLIIQDKASCIPAQVLKPPLNSVVIDACAAPGNKTSHLAALMQNTGKIFAFDICKKRIKTMEKLLKRAGVTNCETINNNFLKTQSTDEKLKDVKYILVDPSCSGSGIVNRLSHLTDTEVTGPERLRSLQEFQKKILNHALSFPNVLNVVYSTCSINEMENEQVVKECLKTNPQFSLNHILPQWPSRGVVCNDFSESFKCVRCDPKCHDTNGFFVALFQRNR